MIPGFAASEEGRRFRGMLLAALIGILACGRTAHEAPTAGTAGGGNAGAPGAAGGSAGSGGAEPVACTLLPCPDSACVEPGTELVVPPGECCPVCQPVPSCSAVTCAYHPEDPPSGVGLDCPPGYDVGVPPGACCHGCVPNGEPFEDVFCGDVDCPSDAPGSTPCPTGYHLGLLAGRCCPECVPDPLTCSEDSDCLLARRSDDCCDCPRAISIRLYEQDACWSALEELRPIPSGCAVPACDLVKCAACAPEAARCVDNRCEEL